MSRRTKTETGRRPSEANSEDGMLITVTATWRLTDLWGISRTFEGLSQHFYDLSEEIPPEAFVLIETFFFTFFLNFWIIFYIWLKCYSIHVCFPIRTLWRAVRPHLSQTFFYCTDSHCWPSPRNKWHMIVRQHAKPMEDKFVFKSCVLLLCKLKYKCIFMCCNII